MKKAHYLPMPGSDEELKIHASYNLGGANYFSGAQDARGLYVHIGPVRREHRPSGMVSESFTAFDKRSYKVLVLQQARRNAKKEAALDSYLENNLEAIGAAYFADDHNRVAEIVKGFGASA